MRDDPAGDAFLPDPHLSGIDYFFACAARAGTVLRYELLDGGRRARVTLRGSRYFDYATRDQWVALAWDEMIQDEEEELVPKRTAAKRIETLARDMRECWPEYLPAGADREKKDREVVKQVLRGLGRIR